MTPLRRLAALAVVLAVGGCDMPTDPLPTNRYDPLYDGERIGTTPTGFRVESATPTSVTFTWDDVSSFETGYRIEERVSPESSSPPRWEAVGRVGADETTFTWEGLTDLTRRQLRLVLEVDGEADSAPGEPLWVAYPTAETGWPGGTLTRDGRRLLADAPSRQTRVYDAATGDLLTTLPFDEYAEAGGERLVGWRSGREGDLVVVDGTEVVGQRSFDCYCSDRQVLAQSGTLVVNWVAPFLETMDLETGAFERRNAGSRIGSSLRPAAVSEDERYVLFESVTNEARFLVYDLEHDRVAWRPSGRFREMVLLPGGEAILAALRVDDVPNPANPAVPVLVDVATGAERARADVRITDLVSVAPDGASFAYAWNWTGNAIPRYRVGVASVATLAPIREAVVEGRADARVLGGGEGWRYVADGRVTTGRFDAVWQQVTVED